MPSAEKSTSAAMKLESPPPNEPKVVEIPQKENALEQSEKSVPANSIQQVISIISNKVRNLEKRKNKLDGYIKEEEAGKELSSEQQKAVSKYDEVVQQLSLSKEFCKQFQGIATAASKDAKREARKTMFARQMQETTKVRDVLMIEDLLKRLKVESIRNDFLNQRNGACPVDPSELEFIDKFAQHVTPLRPNFSNEPSFENAAKTSAEHFSNLIDGRTRPFLDTGVTYEKAKELFNRIQSCSYWEKDVKFVEVTEESRAESDTPNTDDLEAKERSEETVEVSQLPVAAPAPTQVPTPTFNGNVNVLPVQPQMMARIPQQTLPEAPTNVPLNMKTTVTAVENAYFNQLKYSQPQQPPQGQLIANGQLPIVASQNDFGNTNFSFLQDSELDSPSTGSQQQKMPMNSIQPKLQQQRKQQHQQLPQAQTFKHAPNFHPQSPIAAQMYPPGLKVQQQQQLPNSVPHIPVNYQASPQQVPSQVPSHMIPKQQQQPPVNGNQTHVSGYGTQTPPMPQQQPPPQQQQQASRPQAAYPPMVPPAQQQQQFPQQQISQNLPAEQKSVKLDGSGDAAGVVKEKEKPREDYQQQPQIDTWTNETAAQTGGGNANNFPPRSSGGFNRGNRGSGGQGGGAGGAKYNNYRNSQQSRNFENGNGDSSPRDGAPFFRNNERYNGSPAGAARFENRGGGSGGNFKGREGNYRAGSGRFAGSASAAAAQGSSNPGQRK